MGNGPPFGGGGIVGVEPVSPKQSILIYKTKNHYNQWEFLYSQLMDQQMMAGGNAGGIGQPGQPGAPGITQPGGGITPTTGGGGSIGGGIGIQGPGNNGSTPIQPPPTEPPSTVPQ
jgi:hypothetical protein